MRKKGNKAKHASIDHAPLDARAAQSDYLRSVTDTPAMLGNFGASHVTSWPPALDWAPAQRGLEDDPSRLLSEIFPAAAGPWDLWWLFSS